MIMIKGNNSGQAVLIVLLTVVVGMSIALGIFMNSLTDYSTTITEENSDKAFNAAEAGIETMMKKSESELSAATAADQTVSVTGELEANVTVSKAGVFSKTVNQNESASIPLQGATTTQVKVLWTNANAISQNPGSTCTEGNGTAPAFLLIERWRSVSNNISVLRYAVRANSVACASLNAGFVAPGSSETVTDEKGETTYLSSIIIGSGVNIGGVSNPPIDGDSTHVNYDIALRLRPIYNSASMYVTAADGNTLPSQQYSFLSTSSVQDSHETRAIEATKTIPDLPDIFDYALFSGTTLVK